MEQFSLVGDYSDSQSDEEDDGDGHGKPEMISNSVSENRSESTSTTTPTTGSNFFSLDSDSDSNNDDNEQSVDAAGRHENVKQVLLNPFGTEPSTTTTSPTNADREFHNPFNSSTSVGTESVFSIPIRESDRRESELLQHHVKMNSGLVKEDRRTTQNKAPRSKLFNGKKLCWNHQDGKCRFGHKCTFVHDSDLLSLAKSHFATSNNKQSDSKIPSTSETGTGAKGSSSETQTTAGDLDRKKRKLNRGGLTNSVIPTKKALRQYYKTKGTNNDESKS